MVEAWAALCPRVAVFPRYGKQTVKTWGPLAARPGAGFLVWPSDHIGRRADATRLRYGVSQIEERASVPIYKAPIEDVQFLLDDVFQIKRYDNLPGFADASPDVREAILREAAKFCEEVLAPLNRVGDVEGCTRH